MDRDSTTSAAVNTTVIIAAVVAVLVSAVLAPVAYDFAQSSQSEGTVSVVSVSGPITDSRVDSIAEDLREVRQNDSAKAVVLKVDSGGGAVGPSERLYLEVLRTSNEMPVVASVQGFGASGAYYGMLPANEIFVLSSAQVGSVGVIGSAGTVPIPDSIIRTGPDKAQPTTEQRRQQIESLKRQFVNRVMDHRKQNLTISRERIAYARTYLGPRAVEIGYADSIGELPTAIDRAAELADMESYDINRKEPPQTRGFIFATEVNDRIQLYRQPMNGEQPVPVKRPLMINQVPYHDPGVSHNASR